MIQLNVELIFDQKSATFRTQWPKNINPSQSFGIASAWRVYVIGAFFLREHDRFFSSDWFLHRRRERQESVSPYIYEYQPHFRGDFLMRYCELLPPNNY